ncbi:MAG: ATP phosphoribosyltransferase regulatory subunit [Candidatus Methanomethyliaceae archaeon]|nr:ATP phosphoribosyltransferase regulatory subunit [Candidatus Methanomethyliaceae archaeon]
MEDRFRQTFELWGYKEVRTSTIEYFDIIRGGAGEPFADSIFKFQDGDGKLLSLRGEVTTQIARMLASRACSEGRLFYIENCIRFLSPKAYSQREFWQAGAELVGEGGVEADGEVVALALECLERAGLVGAKVDLGSIPVFRKTVEQFNITNYEGLRRAISAKSMGDLREVTTDKRAIEVFAYMMEERGGPDVLTRLSEMGVRGLNEDVRYFEELFDVIKAYGYSRNVRIDLSTLREMKYYNGVVFEIFLEGVGIPIGGGGRYDAMMKEFGMDVSAAGFAVSVDLLVRVVEGLSVRRSSPLQVYYIEGYREKAIGLARRLRDKGKPCTVSRYRGEKEGILVGETIIEMNGGNSLEEKL